MKMQFLFAPLLVFVLAAVPVYAEESNQKIHTEASHMDHQNMRKSAIPQSPGQDAFGAIHCHQQLHMDFGFMALFKYA